MGTVFRLDHRGQTAVQRAVITQRGYVATRLGVDALSAQLYREALTRGLGQAQLALIIADGAVWIWNLAKDRFPYASQFWITVGDEAFMCLVTIRRNVILTRNLRLTRTQPH
jgi:hypothetical protein